MIYSLDSAKVYLFVENLSGLEWSNVSKYGSLLFTTYSFYFNSGHK